MPPALVPFLLEGTAIWRIFGTDKTTLRTVEIAIASCFAELKAILLQERKRYENIGWTRIG